MNDTSSLSQVLYVDDEPDIRMLAQLALESLGGMQVTLCDSAKAAIKTLSAIKPQLILMDVMMPGMDGPALLREIKNTPALYDGPVIFVTAKAAAHDVAHLKSLGACGVIFKPFNPMTLHNEVLGLWKTHNGQA